MTDRLSVAGSLKRELPDGDGGGKEGDAAADKADNAADKYVATAAASYEFADKVRRRPAINR